MLRGVVEKYKHIVFICDDNYVLPTVVAIQSVVENICMEEYYKIHILSWKIAESNCQILSDLRAANVEICLHILDSDCYKEKTQLVIQKTHVTSTALLKFEIPNILYDVSEVLYLDSDLIIKNNLSDIFEYDITDSYLAASFEFWNFLVKYFDFKKDVNIPDFYFNSGVMLLNIKKFREEGLSEKLWDTKINSFNNNPTTSLMDQDVFNYLCASKCLHLPIKYNCNCKFTSSVDINLINRVYGTEYKDCLQLKEDAIIIHYVGKEDKPWIYRDVKCQQEWDYFYKKTVFVDKKLIRKKRVRNIRYLFKRLLTSLRKRGIISTINICSIKKR